MLGALFQLLASAAASRKVSQLIKMSTTLSIVTITPLINVHVIDYYKAQVWESNEKAGPIGYGLLTVTLNIII